MEQITRYEIQKFLPAIFNGMIHNSPKSHNGHFIPCPGYVRQDGA